MPERILGAELAEIERRSFLQFCASRGLPWHEFARFFLLNRRAINQPMAEFCELPGEDPVQDFIPYECRRTGGANKCKHFRAFCNMFRWNQISAEWLLDGWPVAQR